MDKIIWIPKAMDEMIKPFENKEIIVEVKVESWGLYFD
jgi:hypothetical protein